MSHSVCLRLESPTSGPLGSANEIESSVIECRKRQSVFLCLGGCSIAVFCSRVRQIIKLGQSIGCKKERGKNDYQVEKKKWDFPISKVTKRQNRFFIEKYGEENFKLDSSESHEDRMLYYYDLKERQRVEIWEDGAIHILY